MRAEKSIRQRGSTPAGSCGSWLGALGYIVLLDQIGHSLGAAPSASPQGDLRDALQDFTQLPTREIHALWALRCAFAHDYSLFNINVKYPELTHHFLLGATLTEPAITLSAIPWDGKLDHRTSDNQTMIDLWSVGNLVESVVQMIIAMAGRGALVVKLAGGSDELLQRHTVGQWRRETRTTLSDAPIR